MLTHAQPGHSPEGWGDGGLGRQTSLAVLGKKQWAQGPRCTLTSGAGFPPETMQTKVKFCGS